MELSVSIQEKRFRRNGHATLVLGNINFTAAQGEIICLYGPSGCGKTTLLRILAGLDTDYMGSVTLDGQAVLGPTRNIGLTVQTLVSFDWLTVANNISFGLRYSNVRAGATTLKSFLGRVDSSSAMVETVRLAKLVGLSSDDLRKYPDEISGGMKQRMAFARALLPNPKVLLLDEPFSSLDYDSRQSLQELVLEVRKRTGATFVCVTHDPEEALYLADTILVLSKIPSGIIYRITPRVPYKGTDECRYTKEFQQAKRTLHRCLSVSPEHIGAELSLNLIGA